MRNSEPSFEQLCEQFNYTPKNRFLSTEEFAEICGMHLVTAIKKRGNGTGPRYYQPAGSRRVWYSEVDVLRWMASGEKQNTSQSAA